MRGASAIVELKAKTGRSPDAVFVLEDKSSCDTLTGIASAHQWMPEIVLQKTEPVGSMDFSLLDGQIVHAVLGSNYKRSFRICEAIAEANPLYLIANIAGGHPILEWNSVKGFFENE